MGHDRVGILPVKNYTTNIFPEAHRFDVRDRFEILRNYPCVFLNRSRYEARN